MINLLDEILSYKDDAIGTRTKRYQYGRTILQYH